MAKKKKKFRSILYILIGLVVLFIIARMAGWIGGEKPTQVATDKAEKRKVEETVSASGKVQPETEVKLSSEVSGEIVELNVKEGQVVKKGAVLCRIRPDILQSGYDRSVASLNAQKAALGAAEQQLKQTEAAFSIAEATFKRTKALYDRKVISAAEYDQALSDYQGAQANVEVQRQNMVSARFGVTQSEAAVKESSDNLARTTIYAPVDGVVSLLEVELGERVVGTAQMAGTEIMRIANMTSMEVNVDVNESDINRVQLNNNALIEIDAFQGRKFRGVVTEIASSSSAAAASSSTTGSSSSATDQVTNFTVKVRISPESYEDLMRTDEDNPSPFRPGLSATVDIQTKSETGLSVPIQAVTTRDGSLNATGGTADTVAVEQNNNEGNTNSSNTENAANKNLKEVVFVYADGKAKQVEVKTGIQDDNYIRILEGLKEGDEVISRPFNVISNTLKDGDMVEKVAKEKLF